MQAESPAGASLRVHATETLASSAATERIREQVFDVLVQRLPLAVTVEQLGDSALAETVFGRICAVLQSALEAARADPASLSIAIDATTLLPQQLWLRRCEALGPGPVFLLLGSALTPPATDAGVRRQQDKFWLQCWHLRNAGQVRMALAPMVSSPCPLLSSENAFGILPPSGLQVPPGTAWIPMRIDLTDFANTVGELDTFALHAALRACIERGEALHDQLSWPTAAMRHDAWLNRRLAISITGIGDLALLRGLDPGCFHALQELGNILHDVRSVVHDYSRQLAALIEPVPSLEMVDTEHGPDWHARWQKALQFVATRHRNLLAMSPWDVFPSQRAADSRYSDLLPLLEYADVCAFPQPPCLQGWNVNKFKYFHHRAWAILEQKDARKLFAEQI
jgi:hypothetical protein